MFRLNDDGVLVCCQALRDLLDQTQSQAKFNGCGGGVDTCALAKRDYLISVGVPAQALLLTLVCSRDGAKHYVLTIKTHKRDYILSDVFADVARIYDFVSHGYWFLCRQRLGYDVDDSWEMLT